MTSKNQMGFGSSHIGDPGQMNMQPNYLVDLSKTSRTLAAEDSVEFNKTGNRKVANISGASAVIRRAPRIHRRNRERRIAYYQRKHKVG